MEADYLGCGIGREAGIGRDEAVAALEAPEKVSAFKRACNWSKPGSLTVRLAVTSCQP